MAVGHGFMCSVVSLILILFAVNNASNNDELRLSLADKSGTNTFWTEYVVFNPIIRNESIIINGYSASKTMSRVKVSRSLFTTKTDWLVATAFVSYDTPLVYLVRKRFLRRCLGYTSNSTAIFNPEILMLTRSGVNIWNPGPDSHAINDGLNDFRSCNVILPGNNGLKIGQWNINHLTDVKLEQIKSLLTAMKYEIHVLFLIETFLKPNKPDGILTIPGYTLFRKDRHGQKKGGGIIAYVTNSVTGIRISELENDEVESLWLNINPHKSKRPLLVGAIYRPPGSTVEADTKLELNIEDAYLRNQETYVVGDFNINYLDSVAYNKHHLGKALKSLNLSQVITTVTRPVSSTCLDHVYTTHPNFIADISIPNIGLADHLPVFFRRKYCKQPKHNQNNIIQYRDFKKLNSIELHRDLQNTPWDSAFETNNVNAALNNVEKMLNEVLDKHIPLKSKRVKKPSQPAWMTKEINVSMRQRDNLLKNARKSDRPVDWANYKKARCKTTNLIRKTKRKYFCDKIDENKGNPGGVWKALRSLSGTTKPSVNIKELTTENGTISDKNVITNTLNNHFTNVLEYIRQDNDCDAQYDDTKLRTFVSSRLDADTTFNIPKITKEQITEIINNIPDNKATGHDGISVRVIKEIIPTFISPLCKLLNLSIESNTFPDNWKTAQVIPLYKNGARNDTNNYRPISILPALSKVLEKHVARSLFDYLRTNNLIYKLQSAFRPGHSTETALIKLTDEILFNMDRDEVTGLVFIDFKKAFDIIDHELLLKKLSAYGASISTVNWMKSYLSERKQFTKLGNTISDRLPIKNGVPQGSILGPVLFLLFINDMPLHISTSNMDIYADDTTLSSSASWKEIPALQQVLTKDLEIVETWSRTNKMFINTSKTKAMILVGKCLRKRLDQDPINFQLSLNNKQIDFVKTYKLLGLKIDDDLTYDEHIDELCNKLSKRIGLLRHISPYLKQKQRLIFYQAVIKPVMLYGSPVWSSCSSKALDRVFRLQKRAARIILGVDRITRTVTMFNELKWVPFYTEAYVIRCGIAYKRLYGNIPDYLKETLKTNSDVHTRVTRYSKINFICPHYNKITNGGRTFAIRTIKDWNNLGSDLKKIETIKKFKKTLFQANLDLQKANGFFTDFK